MLDAASLEAIAQEARNCFLYEDAPDFLNLLVEGLERLRTAYAKGSSDLEEIHKDLIRAAHSLKGGSGMAQMPILNGLTHRLEDLFEAMADNRIKDLKTALELAILAMEEARSLLEAVTSGLPESAEAVQAEELTNALLEFLGTVEAAEPTAALPTDSSDFLRTALRVDLEDCLQRLAAVVQTEAIAEIEAALAIFAEECLLLGEALGCPWLGEVASLTRRAHEQQRLNAKELAGLVMGEIHQLRSQYLEQGVTLEQLTPSEKLKQLVPQAAATVPAPAVTAAAQPAEEEESQNKAIAPEFNLRIPVSRLDQMSNLVSELLISHERLLITENQLRLANLNLKQRSQQLKPLREQVQSLYDRLSVADGGILPGLSTSNSEFDSLQFDRYTDVHTTLQQFQELMVQVQEIREDVDLVWRDFQETLRMMRHQLDSLHGDLNQSRLVPFGTLAGRFVQPIATLSQRHNKAVELAIEGEEVAVDQAVLEQLRTPLTHLLRNAFDHGIELPQERIAQGKTRTGKIRLIATQKSNFVTITVADDGRGVNLDKVYQRAVAQGLCSPETRFEQLTQEQILEFLFTPGFSTAATVGSLSGRGVGLDIVRSDVERLHGSLRIETEPGWGSQFIIRIPLTLNILPLLLCRSHQRCLAIPAENVSGVISISDFPTEATDETGLMRRLHWHNQWLPLVSLQQLLPYQQSTLTEGATGLPNIGIVLSMNDKYLVAAIDEMLGERRLVVKPFDSVVPIPSYLAGCTVLGTGEVVPIVVPDYFEELLAGLHAQAPEKHPPVAIAGERPSILVVDDSIAVRRTLNRLLTQAGYQVLQCRDGQEAWEVLNQQNMAFNLAICDLEMPRMDGFTLLQKIRASGYKELPVVVLTSRESDLHRKKASQLGANGYMTKPFHPVAFLEEISDFLQPVASA